MSASSVTGLPSGLQGTAHSAGSRPELTPMALTNHVNELEQAVKSSDAQKVTAVAQHLLTEGKMVAAQQILKKDHRFNPLPMAIRLVTALDAPGVFWSEEIVYDTLRCARMFIELALIKAQKENRTLDPADQAAMEGTLNRVQKHFQKDEHVCVRYELKCCSEALKPLKVIDSEIFWDTLTSALEFSPSAAVNLGRRIGDLVGQRSNGEKWLYEAIYINWMGHFARTNVEFFNTIIQDYLQFNLNCLELAQMGVEFLADMLAHGTPDIQWKALTGKVGLISLLNQKRQKWDVFGHMWEVRYRAVQVLSVFAKHSNPKIAETAYKALLDRRLEEGKKSKLYTLFAALDKDPTIHAQWTKQFKENEQTYIKEGLRRQEELEELDASLRKEEELLAHSDAPLQEIESQRKILLQKRSEIEELRSECEALRENNAILHEKLLKGFNQFLDGALDHTSSKEQEHPPQFCCLITHELMLDPVRAEDGRCYESTAMTQAILSNSISSITRQPFTLKSMSYFDSRLKDEIARYTFTIAKSYLLGLNGKTQNLAIAVQYLEHSAKQGYGLAQYLMGFLSDDAYIDKKLEVENSPLDEVFQWYSSEANKMCLALLDCPYPKSPKCEDWYNMSATQHLSFYAICRLGSLAFRRSQSMALTCSRAPLNQTQNTIDTVLKELKKAIEFHQQAADKGYPHAQFLLGVHHASGVYVLSQGKSPNWDQLLTAYRSWDHILIPPQWNTSLESFDQKAVAVKKIITPSNFTRAVECYRCAAKLDHVQAQFNLGYTLFWYKDKECETWFQKAADRDHLDAMFYMGILCLTRKEGSEAEKWFYKAAIKGHSEGQYLTASAMFRDKNEVEGIKWLRLAAKQDHRDAQLDLGLCLLNSETSSKEDKTEGVVWIRQAAVGGYWKACLALSECYTNGWGVDKNPEEAEKWLQKGHAPFNALELLRTVFSRVARKTYADITSTFSRIF